MEKIKFTVNDITKLTFTTKDVVVKEVYPPLINETVIPTKEQQVLKHEGEYGYDEVTVEPIPDEYIIPEGTLPITENITYDVTPYARVTASVKPAPVLQDKEVTPTKETQTVTYDENYDGLGNVTVKPIPSQYGDLNEYFTQTIGGGNGITTIYTWENCFKKFPPIPLAQSSMKQLYNSCPCSEIDFTEIKKNQITNMSSTFNSCDNLTYLDFSEVDLSKLTQFDNTFYNCTKLKEIDFGDCDFSSVTYGPSTFASCSVLEKITWGDINMPNNRNLSYMFSGCTALTSLNVKNLCGATNTTLQNIFKNCQVLNELDLSGWDTSGVTQFEYAFNACKALTSLDLSKFNMSSATTIAYMFTDCTSLATLNVSTWDTSNISNMSYTFSGCNILAELNLSNWDTSNVTNFSYMFQRCSLLEKLDLSSFTIGEDKTPSFNYMFYNSKGLREIDLSNLANAKACTLANMFRNCTVLEKVDMRSFDFTLCTSYSNMLTSVPTDCLIIVADDTQKDWFASKFATYTNVKTVAELEAA